MAAMVLIGIATAAFWFLSPANAIGLFRPDDTETVMRGKVVYAEHCASCHGENLEGEEKWRRRKPDGRLPAPPHDASGHTWHHHDWLLFKLTKFGLAKVADMGDYQTDMPTYEGVLSDDDIIAVLSFIKSTWPSDVRDRHDEMNRMVPEEEK